MWKRTLAHFTTEVFKLADAMLEADLDDTLAYRLVDELAARLNHRYFS
jgi:hypothetical protein